MKNIVSFPNKTRHSNNSDIKVHVIQWDRIPDATKNNILGCVFSLLAAFEDATTLKEIESEIMNLSEAFSPCHDSSYCVVKTMRRNASGILVDTYPEATA